MTNNSKNIHRVEIKEKYHSDSLFNYYFLVIVLAVLSAAFAMFIAYIFMTNPTSKYFLSDKNDRLFQQYPLNQKLYTDVQVMDWASQALIATFDFNFLNYKYHLKYRKSLFTDEGHNKAIQMIERVIVAPIVAKNNYVAMLNLCDIPSLDRSKSGIFMKNGVQTYIWTIALPVFIDFRRKDERLTVVTKAIVQVERVSDLEYLGGLAISDMTIIKPTILTYNNRSKLPVCIYG